MGKKEKKEKTEEEVLCDRVDFTWPKTCNHFELIQKKVENKKNLADFTPKPDSGPFGLTIDLSAKMQEKTMDSLYKYADTVVGLSIMRPTGDKVISNVKKILSSDFNIVVLRFSGVAVEGKLLEALLAAVVSSPVLESLGLARSKLRNAGCLKLCQALVGANSKMMLTDLSLSGNLLGPEAAVGLSELVDTNESLEVLDLSTNKLKTVGAIPIFEALTGNKTLKAIALDRNQIYSAAVTSLRDVVINNSELRVISLKGNAIDDAGTNELINCVRVKKIMLSTLHFQDHQQDFETFTSLDLKAGEDIPEVKYLSSVLESFKKQSVSVIRMDDNINQTNKENLDYVLNAPLMSVFRMKSGKLSWSREAWFIAESEFGPKFIGDSVKALGKKEKQQLGEVLRRKNEKNQLMLEVLLRNKFVNEDIFGAVKVLVEKVKFDVKQKDSLGRPFIEVMRHHESPSIRKWSSSLGALDKKYIFSPVPPLHISPAAEVLLARKVETNEEVVVKMFRNKKDFDQEIFVRKKLGKKAEKQTNFKMKLQRRRRELGKRTNFKKIQEKSTRRKEDVSETVLVRQEMDEYIVKMIGFNSRSRYFYAAYEKADRSLRQIMNTERLAGINLQKIKVIAKRAAECLNFVNSKHICHADFKPNALMRMNFDSEDYKLIDFDCSVEHGQRVMDTFSSAFIPPEVALAKLYLKNKLEKDPDSCTEEERKLHRVKATEKFDVWSFGVVLFELLAGVRLFNRLKMSDDLSTVDQKALLINWLEIPEEKLLQVLEVPEKVLPNRDVFFARELVRWCLQRSPESRPSFNQILRHPFFLEGDTSDESNVDLPRNYRTHLFLSHIQSQAAGTVKDVYYAARNYGCTAWLDMKAGSITQGAMMEGVRLTEAFVVCLTKDTFFSYFCLKEFMWALDYGKRIVFLVEEDHRELMNPFKVKEFREKFESDAMQQKLISGLGDFDSLLLSKKVKEVVDASKEEIESKYDGNPVAFVLKEMVLRTILDVLNSESAMPYRRREYENQAMMENLLEQIGFVSPSDPYLEEEFVMKEIDHKLGEKVKEAAEEGIVGVARKKHESRKKARKQFHKDRKRADFQRRKMMLKHIRGNKKRNMRRKTSEDPTSMFKQKAMHLGEQLLEKAQEKAEEMAPKSLMEKMLKKKMKPPLLKNDNDSKKERKELGNVLSNCKVVVLVGSGEAEEMCESIREGVQRYSPFEDFGEQWVEVSSTENIRGHLLDNLMSQKKVAVLALITPGFFSDTKHDENLQLLEQALKAKGVQELPVVMVQKNWFGRGWDVIQAEVGETHNHYLLDVEFMPFRAPEVRAYEHEAMVGEISRRLNDFCDEFA